jgi:Zn-dependent metalloprotease
MRTRLHKIASGIFIAVYIFWMVLPGTVFAIPPQSSGEYSPAAKHQPKRGVNPETGNVSFIGAEDPIHVPGVSDVKGLDASARAMGMANVYGREFGLKNPSQELKLLESKKDHSGKDIAHFQQTFKGVPVIAGEMIVNMKVEGDLLSISGEVSPDLALNINPVVQAGTARKTAVVETAKLHEINEKQLVASDPELWIFDESLLTSSTRPVELVWRMEVTAKDATQPIREMVLVNAQTGEVSFHVNQVDMQSQGPRRLYSSPSETENFQEPLAAWPLYFDIELDETRDWIYGSDSTGNKIDVISTSTLELVKSFVLVNGANPKGIALSPDGNELAIAQNGASSLLFLNPDTGDTIASVVPNTGSLNNPWDVIYGREGRLYSSGNPGSSSTDYIHIIDTMAHVEIARSSYVMRMAPVLAISLDKKFLYTNDANSSPQKLYKIDVSSDALPTPISTAHLSGFTGRDYILDVANDLIFTNTGQVWTTDLKAKIGETGVAGELTLIATRDAIAIATSSNTIVFASTEDFYPLSTYELPVPGTIGQLLAQADGNKLYANTSSGFVAVDLSAFPPGEPSPMPTGSSLYFDLVLDETHGVLYGSNTTGQRIDVISTSTLQVIDQIRFNNGSRPRGMDLNPSTHELAVALTGASQIAFIDTNTREIVATVIPLADHQPLPFDVKYGRAGRLYSTGSGYIHVINTVTHSEIGRSLPPGTITDDPYLEISADKNIIYANDSTRLYKFDVSTDSPGLVASTPFTSSYVAAMFILDTVHDLIFTDTGRVWNSALTGKVGSTGISGKLTIIPARNAVAIAASNNTIVFASTENFYSFSTSELPIPGTIGPLIATTDGSQLFVSTSNGITAIDLSSFPPGQPSDFPSGSLPYSDLVLDEARGVLYGSNTTGHKIDVISISTLQILDEIRLYNGSSPKGMDLNPATNQLAVALSGASQVAFIDTNTYEITGTVIPVLDGDNKPFDVKYGRTKRLYSTGSATMDYLHVIDTEMYMEIGHSVYPNDISYEAYLAISADKNFIYANEAQFITTDTLYKFNVSTDNLTLQTKTDFSSNYAANNFLLLRDNTKVFTDLGQVWSSDLRTRLGSFSAPGHLLEIPESGFVAVLSTSKPGLITFIGSTDYHPVSTISLPALNAIGASEVTADGERLFLNTNTGIKALNISANDPTAISVESGSLQSVQVSTGFQESLKVKVQNIFGDPIPGVSVTFQAPTSGASGTFSDTNSNMTSAVTDANGIATSSILTANNIAGKYLVQAFIPSLEISAAFQLENLASVTCTVLNGSGPATLFLPYKQFRCGLTTYGLAIGDFNTDGRKDVAISAAFGRLLVFLQDQNGNLSPPRVYAGGESGSAYVIAGDLNQDGRDDMAIPSMGGILVFYQKADGTFPYPVKYTIEYAAAPMAIDDVNHDGLADLVVAMTANLIGVLTQKEDGTLNPMVTYPSLGSAEIAIGDINSDGLKDLVSMNTQTTNQLQIFTQKSDHTLNPYVSTGLISCSSYCSGGGIGIGDITGDGRLDIVMSYGGNRPSSNIAVFAQDASGNLLPPVSFPSYDIPDPVEVADVNLDDRLDIVTLHSGWSRAGVYLGQEDGSLGAQNLYQIPYKSSYYPLELDLNDVNSDGLLDVLITDSQGLVILYRSSEIPPTPTVVPSVTPGTPIPPTPSFTPEPTLTPSLPAEGGYRSTYSVSGGTMLPGGFLCNQTKIVCTNGSNLDADQAHLYAAHTFNFYKVHHGRNSYNGLGATIISSVDYGIGYQNAFWNGSQMVYGDAMAADDVVGHELTHAVTEYTSDLIYSYQSGAINESLSDLWGEFIDQTNGSGNDDASVTWLLAEDSALGPIRSMKNPPAYGDPDRMGSPNYYTGSGDNGGVHINSGVNNKAAYLIVAGGTFNGKGITGIGLDKTAAVYYEVQTHLLTSGSNFNDLYYALDQGCRNLIGGVEGITQTDCNQVVLAADAVEMGGDFSGTATPTPTATYTPSTITPSVFPPSTGTPNTPTPVPTLKTLWFTSNQWAYAQFGGSVNSAGDVNGDGFDDVLIGSSEHWDGQLAEGAAFLYYGSPTGPIDTAGWSVQSNHANWAMGDSIDTAGDVNGDGYDDILVNVPGYSDGQSGEGAVFAYYGSPNGPTTTPNWIAESNVPSMGFGTSISAAGDLNADGYDDVIIGTRYCDNGQTDEGCVYVYMGSANGLKPTPAWVMDSDTPNAGFGYCVDRAGDVNGDGYGDVLITSYNYISGQMNGGRAYVFHGGPDGLKYTPLWVGDSGIANDGYGLSAAGAGDVNGDGYSDVLVGAPSGDPYTQIEGKAYVYLGSPTGPSLQPDWTAQAGNVDTRFGDSLSFIGDFNHDGYDDLVVGDPNYYFSQSIAGAVFVYFGSSSGPVANPSFWFTGGLNNSAFGSAVGPAGHVDSDPFADFLVGAPMWWNPGRALLVYGYQLNPMPTKTPTITATPPTWWPDTSTPTRTGTPTRTPTATLTRTPTRTQISTPTQTITPTSTSIATQTTTSTVTATPTITLTSASTQVAIAEWVGGAQDGWVLESSETSNQGGKVNPTATTFILGDNANNRQYRSILHFNTKSLPDNAVITKVVLKIKKQGVTGTDPFTTHRKIAIDIRRGAFSDSGALQATDFQAAAGKLGAGMIANNPQAGGWYSARLNSTAYPYINRTGITQFRLRFQLDDDNDAIADFLRFYSGNAGHANRPILVIEYYVP